MKKHNLLSIPLAIFTIIALLNISASGQGMYTEFKLTTDGATASIKTYSQDGNRRVQNDAVLAAEGGVKTSTIIIALKDSPNVIFVLNDDDKTYSTEAANPGAKPIGADEFEVTVLGKEKINNYNSTHVKVLYKTTKKEVEMWTSAEVVNFDALQTIKNKFLDGSDFFKALDAKGAAGFPVRLIITNNGHQVQLDLVAADKRAIDNSLFSLAGYTKSMGPTGTYNGKPTYDQQKIEQLKNMTPAQRQQYIDEMKKQAPHQ